MALEKGKLKCPKCDSTDIELDPLYSRDPGREEIYECHNCGSKFDSKTMEEK